MEIDVPQLNGFAYNASKVAKKSVHFGSPPASAGAATAAAEITIVTKKSGSSAKPKHKARRRARHPSKSEDVENGEVPKPISPSKVHKMAERNRHSRSGLRGLPKKGVDIKYFDACFYVFSESSRFIMWHVYTEDPHVSQYAHDTF